MLTTLSGMRRMRAVVATTTLACLQACYAFAPLAATSTRRAAGRVRVVLTPQGTVEMARYLGPNVAAVEGGLSSTAEDGAMLLAVDFVETTNGIKQPWSGEGVVSFPAQYRREVHERVFQKRRSIVAGTLLGAALVTVAIIALKIGGAKGGPEAGGGQPPG